jgi:UDP-glucose 4-epimerase
MKKTLLVNGATGYIGFHTWCALLAAGYEVIGLDNLRNCMFEVVGRVAKITKTQLCFFEGDVRDTALLGRLFLQYEIESVIHFAALKAVGESVENPHS